MPSRLKRSCASRSSLSNERGASTPESFESSNSSTKRRKISAASKGSDTRHPSIRNSRSKSSNDGDAITIVSDSDESSTAAIETRRIKKPTVMDSRPNGRPSRSKPSDDNEAPASSSSSSVARKHGVDDPNSTEAPMERIGRSAKAKSVGIGNSTRPKGKLSSEEEVDMVEAATPKSSESLPRKSVTRRRRVVSSSSEDGMEVLKKEEGESGDFKSKTMPRRLRASPSSSLSSKSTKEVVEDRAPTPRKSRRKGIPRKRCFASSSESEPDKKAALEGEEKEDKLVVVMNKKERKSRSSRSIKQRLRRRGRKSASSSSSDGGENSSGSSGGSDSEEKDERKEKGNGKKSPKKGEAKPEQQEEGEGSGEDGDDGKKGRRKIRKILKDKKLSSQTKNAEALERERRKRLEERQKLYNSVLENIAEGASIKHSSVVLDIKKDSGEPLIEVHPELAKHLKPHQIEAVRFLYDNIIESVDEHNAHRGRLSGAILAHCMGLGKSLSTITFIHTIMTHPAAADLGIKRCLILCPVNTLLNWHREWRHWVPEDAELRVHELATSVTNSFRIDVIRHWHNDGGVLLMGYDMYRNITTSLLKKTRKISFKNTIPAALIDPGPDIVVCDEGHLLKNCKTGVTKAINNLKTPKRIILTGTPLQNNLFEYWTMVNFVKPNLLGSQREFANRFANPIKNGQHSNSTQRDVQLMKKRAHVLFKTLDGCVQRRDYSCLTQYLPPRLEYVIKIRLSDVQCELYRAFLQYRVDRGVEASGEDRKNTLFRDQQTLYRVWTHPYTLKMHESREAKRMLMEDSTTEEEDDEDEDDMDERDDGDDDDEEAENSSSGSCSSSAKNGASTSKATAASASHSRTTRARTRQQNRDSAVLEILSDRDEGECDVEAGAARRKPSACSLDGKDEVEDLLKPWWHPLYRSEYDLRIDVGAKLSALFFILKKCSEIGDKVLIFSQSLFSLDLIEWFLAAVDRQWCITQGLEVDRNSKWAEELDQFQLLENFEMPCLAEFFSDMGQNRWRRGQDYERIDGSLNAVARNTLQTRFNDPGQRFRLLIISTRAGGLGVNLTAANRLIIFDVSWNPSHDIQSIFRSYRFGQIKPVYIYRLVAQGSMEEKIYDRQVTKQSLALRVIDEQQIDRHFKEEDLRELYTFSPDPWDDEKRRAPPPALPKDRLLADLLSERPELVVSYHNHDSLLENRLDEGLSEAERAEAWREYEEEKRVGRPMTEYQRLLLNNPAAAAAFMAERQQRFEAEHRQRMMHYIAAGNRVPYASLNPTPTSLVDSMFTAVPSHRATQQLHPPPQASSSASASTSSSSALQRAALRPIAPRMPFGGGDRGAQGMPSKDMLSDSFNAMCNMLLMRYPALARNPSQLHETAVRLFVNSIANNVAAQTAMDNAQVGSMPGATIPPAAAANLAHLLNPAIPGPQQHQGANLGTGGASAPIVVDVDNDSADEAGS